MTPEQERHALIIKCVRKDNSDRRYSYSWAGFCWGVVLSGLLETCIHASARTYMWLNLPLLMLLLFWSVCVYCKYRDKDNEMVANMERFDPTPNTIDNTKENKL